MQRARGPGARRERPSTLPNRLASHTPLNPPRGRQVDQYKSELEKAKSEVETLTKTKDRLKADKDEMAGRRDRHPSRITLPKRDPWRVVAGISPWARDA